MKRQLIVNADDFGWSPEVNAGIVRGHGKGVLTSTTLMVNAPGFEDAVAMARGTPSLGIGLHINLTQGSPVASPETVRSLLDANGGFRPANLLVKNLLYHRIPAGELEAEIRAQLQKFRRHLGEPTHLDSHQHVHVFGVMPHVLAALAGEFQRPRIRCPLERMRAGILRRPGAMPRLLALRVSCGRARPLLARAGYVMPDGFHGLMETGFLTAAACVRLLESLPGGTTELMCHPGEKRTSASGPTFKTRLAESRPAELEAILDPALSAVVRREQIDLVSYAAL